MADGSLSASGSGRSDSLTGGDCDPAVVWFYFEDAYTAARAALLDHAGGSIFG